MCSHTDQGLHPQRELHALVIEGDRWNKTQGCHGTFSDTKALALEQEHGGVGCG